MSLRARLNAVEAVVLKSMTNEELEALAVGGPDIDFSSFTDAELDALIYDRASPALEQKYLDARAQAEAGKS